MKWRSFYARRTLWITVASVVVLAVAVRVALPPILKDYVNKRLAEIHGYYGHVDDIDVHLIRGAYVLKDLKLLKENGKVRTPFVAADRVDISVEWHALFDGAFVGEMAFCHGRLNFVKGPSKAESQSSIDHSWMPVADKLFPLRFNKVELTDGEIHYLDTNHHPSINVYVDHVTAVATNLTNSKDISDNLYAVIEVRGLAMREAPVEVHMVTNPNAHDTNFDVNASLRNLKLVDLNGLVHEYGGFDFERGSFEADTELAAARGNIHGYVKPILKDVKIFNLEEDKKKPLKALWEMIVGGIGKLFTNHEEHQMATVIPVQGAIDQPGTSTLAVIAGLFENAFIQAIKPGVEGTVGLDKINTPEKQKEQKDVKKEVQKKEADGGR
ncbi:MAG TPA: DUF748 domain-containing protein [Candidatus Krumholzibacteria bacterium]|nr:DUF748 domain-containing protein [Candidatus Krumholzibacteria bacterium]